jgi:membrane-bound lytic murein transglycosylase B
MRTGTGHPSTRFSRPRAVRALAVAGGLAVLASSVGAAPADGGHARHRGWGYLVEKLVADGVPRARATAVFADPRVEPFHGVDFALAPREPRSIYRGFLAPASVTRARRCLESHAGAFAAAERAHGVPASVLAAILHVESGCGRNTGSHRVLHALARLAMANEPANVRRNVARHKRSSPSAGRGEIEQRTRARAEVLERTFYPEVRATFALVDRLGIDPLGIRGSRSGAFGLPQFLPRSYLCHAVDGNGDGRVSLYDAEDAIASCASYLAAHGWRPGLSPAERRRVLWAYNHSTAYIDTVLALAGRLTASAPRVRGGPTGAPERPTWGPLDLELCGDTVSPPSDDHRDP